MSAAGKVALVTGASAGIGKASGLALMRDGWSVVFTARRVEQCEAAIRESGAPDRGCQTQARHALRPLDQLPRQHHRDLLHFRFLLDGFHSSIIPYNMPYSLLPCGSFAILST
jgi:NAD(P)-dependent dehydrogenase (short-subunit alcohol dehydrogenase family)